MDKQNNILPEGLGVPDRKNQKQLFKSAVLAALSIASFGVCWQLFSAGFSNGQNLLFWFYPFLAASLGVTFFTFFCTVNRNRLLLWGTLALILVWYILAMPKDLFVIVGGALFGLLALLFDSRVKHDENSRADFSMSRVMRGSINIMIYALLFVIGFTIYFKSSAEFINNPKQFYDQIGQYAATGLQYIPSGLGNYNPNQHFDDFIAGQAQSQDPGYAQAPPTEQNQIFTEVKNQLLSRFNIQVSGNPLLGDVVAGAVSDKVQSAAASYQDFFPAIFAIIVIALLRTLSFLFVWLTLFVSWLMFHLLLLVNFFRIKKVQVEVNKLQV